MRKRINSAVLLILILFLVSSVASQNFRDEDYDPQGTDNSPGDAVVGDAQYEGVTNKLEDYSDTLENPSKFSSATIWDDSVGSKDSADQYAITKTLEWSIANTGAPYPPGPPHNTDSDGVDWDNPYAPGRNTEGGTYYSRDYNGPYRDETTDPSVPKPEKVFGNSYAALAGSGLDGELDDTGNTYINKSDGVWIDPDELWKYSRDGLIQGPWERMLVFNIDITGPDSGLGLDTGDGTGRNYPRGERVMYGDVYFEGELDEKKNDGDSRRDEGPSQESYEGTNKVGETINRLKPPMCGDDQNEYLVEEMGESVRSSKHKGKYACAGRINVCVDMSASGSKIFETGRYRQTDEYDENERRLKNDKEYCGWRSGDTQPIWWDQDYGKIETRTGPIVNVCKQDNLIENGTHWFSKSYVENHPKAVSGGVDDDWNERLSEIGHPDVYSDSPVPPGSPNKSIATKGFCGGDDGGEVYVTQECNTDLCETDRTIRGVAKVPGSCIYERDSSHSEYPVSGSFSDKNSRKIYEPGEEITLDLDEPRTIACFNGVWYEDWPISIGQQNVEVPLGQTVTVPFSVVNIRKSPQTFEVRMEDPGVSKSAYQFTEFAEYEGDSFTVTVPSQSSRQFNLEITGGVEELDEPTLYVEANGVNTDIHGEDSLTVEIVNNTQKVSEEGGQNTESVPGIGALHLLVISILGSVFYLLNA